jgi:hypothetical protein
MKQIILFISLIVSHLTYSQYDVTTTDRKNTVLQATFSLVSSIPLFAGQQYTIYVAESGAYDVFLKTENLKVEFIEGSKNSTGGLGYKITPIDTGICYLAVGAIVDKKNISLLAQNYKVINYPVPPIFISDNLFNSVVSKNEINSKIVCNYPKAYGIMDAYPIKSWTINIENTTIKGDGDQLTIEALNAIKNSKTEILQISVVLEKNPTGHQSSEGVFIIR